MNRSPVRASLLLFLILAVGVSLLIADGGANHQSAQSLPVELGTSGGNITDITNAFCCSGTLGSLVQRGGTNYILSNNHILARTSQTAAEVTSHVGDDVSQPGLIDNGCRPGTIVADFSDASPLGTQNVDAAIAQIRSGAVNTTGEIIDVGIPSQTPAAPTVGRGVAKSGRTTGLTCASVGSINTDVGVRYQKNCNAGKKFVISYQDQVVVNSSSFSAGGDSGSLIVTSDTAQPLALLYAGSSTTTIGNPVGDVISALGVSFVGGNSHAVSGCDSGGGGGGGKPPGVPPGPPQHAIDRATAAKNAHAQRLFQNPAVQGVGVGASDVDPSEAVVVIYTIAGQATRPMPRFLDGVATKTIVTDRFVAYGWNESDSEPRACSAK